MVMGQAIQSMDSSIGATIGAGAQLIGGALDRRFASGQSKQGRSFALHQGDIAWNRAQEWRDNERDWSTNEIRRRVFDARKAGLHPLFALGMPGTTPQAVDTRGRSPTFPDSGSHMGSAVARAGGIVGRAVAGARERRMEDEIHQLRLQKMEREIKLDDAALLAAASALGVAKQKPLWGDSDPGVTGGGVSSDGIKAYPHGELAADTALRPTMASPKKSLPMRAEVIADDGYRYRIVDPDTGDEVSQADLLSQIILRHTRKARLAPGRELRIQYNRLAAAIKRRLRDRRRGRHKRKPLRRHRYGRRY